MREDQADVLFCTTTRVTNRLENVNLIRQACVLTRLCSSAGITRAQLSPICIFTNDDTHTLTGLLTQFFQILLLFPYKHS